MLRTMQSHFRHTYIYMRLRGKYIKIENWTFNSLVIQKQQQVTQPTYDTSSKILTQATLVEGIRFHHCTTPAPHKGFSKQVIQYPHQNCWIRTSEYIAAWVTDWHFLFFFFYFNRAAYCKPSFLSRLCFLALETVPHEERLAFEALRPGPSVHLHHLLPERCWCKNCISKSNGVTSTCNKLIILHSS